MLVLCNGGAKCGSTWLNRIVVEMGGFGRIPESYQNPKWRNPSILPAKVPALLDNEDLATKDFHAKTHFGADLVLGEEPRTMKAIELLEHEHVRVVNIVRDIRDVIVSRYHHEKRLGKTDLEFRPWFRRRAEAVVNQHARYHLGWHSGPNQPLLLTYEGLHADFMGSVGRLAEFLGRPSGNAKLAAIREATDFRKAVAKEGQPEDKRFFRKGTVGDWKNFLTTPMRARVDELVKGAGFDEFAKNLSQPTAS